MNCLFKQFSKNTCRSLFQEYKRYAGHAKWQNIKHIKEAKDNAKALLFSQMIQKMKVAIVEGKSADPEDNSKLAKLIDQAKKNNMPKETINNFLKRMSTTNTNTQYHWIETRGPGGCVIIMHAATDNLGSLKTRINTHFRKTRFTQADSRTRGIYIEKGIIITEFDGNIDKATDDAIIAGAEEVEKINNDDQELLQFICPEGYLDAIRRKLEDLNYNILSADEECIPQVLVNLTDQEKEWVNKLYERLKQVPEVDRVFDNIGN